MYYAQLDTNNICFAVVETNEKLEAPNCIEIDKYDESLLGKMYNFNSKEFEEVLQPKKEVSIPQSEFNQLLMQQIIDVQIKIDMLGVGV